MAEIKSTLDLVMEKTRHLTLSSQEKEENERREFSLRLQGMLKNLEDGRQDFRGVEEEISRLLEKYGNGGRKVVCRQLAARMGVGKDNGPWIGLLTRHCRADADRLKQATENARLGLSRAMEQRGRELLDELVSMGIRGSAVQPNLDGDPVLEQIRQDLEQHFKRTLADIVRIR
jgi:hypothetical protein